MKRKLHKAMHEEHISFHHKSPRKSDEINSLSRGDGHIMAETAHENHR